MVDGGRNLGGVFVGLDMEEKELNIFAWGLKGTGALCPGARRKSA